MAKRFSKTTLEKLLAANVLFAIPLIVVFSLLHSPMTLIAAVVLFAVFAVSVLVVEVATEPAPKRSASAHQSGSQPKPGLSLQFDLRDILLTFVFVAATMGLAGKFGGPIAAYLLTVICVARVFFSRSVATRLFALVTGLLLGMCCVCWLPFIETHDYHHARCKWNLRQIGAALQNYCHAEGQFPMAHKPDDNGTPTHSWRVALLPRLGYEVEYEQYDYTEAWDGPNNSLLAGSMPYEYTCPSSFTGPPVTDIVAITGPRTAWPEDRAIGPKEMPDGTSNTIMLAEVANSNIHWMSPRDLTMDDLARGMQPQGGPGISSHHASGAHVLYADGHVQFLSNRTSPEVLESLATIDGGEKVSAREEEERRQAQETSRQRRMERAAPFTFALMVISGFILAFRPFPKRGEDAAPGSKQPNTPAPDGEEDE